MKAPKYIASLVLLAFGICAFSELDVALEAGTGLASALVAVRVFGEHWFHFIHARHDASSSIPESWSCQCCLGWAVIALGFILEIGLTYVLVYFPTRFMTRRF